MRILICFFFVLTFADSFAQDRYYSGLPYSYNYEYNEEDYESKYPYVKGYTPVFFGAVVGYNVLKAQEVEAGLVVNFFDGLSDFGMTGGYQLIYKRSLENQRNAVDFEMGVYGILSLGIGVNYNFSRDVSAFGFKPFIGTSIYHFQVLYGYNFLRKQKKEWYQMSSHSLSIRYVIPIKAGQQSYFYLPPPPNYRNLRGLHKEHPLKRKSNSNEYEINY